MALTITLVPDSRFEFGNFTGQIIKCVPAASDYPTAGYALGPAQCALRTLAWVAPQPSTGSSTPATAMPFLAWDAFNQKLQAFLTGAVTPAGTVTPGTVTVVTGQSAGDALQITPASNAGVLGTTSGSAGSFVIPGATFGLGNGTFTGSAGTAALLAECASGTDLSAYEFLCFCLGTP